MRALDRRQVDVEVRPRLRCLLAEQEDHAQLRQQSDELLRYGTRLVDVSTPHAAPADMPRHDVPTDQLASSVQANVAQQIPEVLCGGIVVIWRLESGSERGAFAGAFEHARDAGVHARLRGVDQGIELSPPRAARRRSTNSVRGAT
jgi:hypothetical protein